ncbi:MAG TPA: family 1 glycosylhydrolase, partial [Chlamydiales bacterium]|nr:family 1 glycosylhydrolase [Chlamydiales bacterium]
VKIYRCSVSRDKLQPQKDGPFDPAAVQHLRDHIRLFRANGIDLRVTLSHFAEPLYFSWDRAGDVAGFVDFAERVSEILYEEGVRTIVTINEPTVVAFQGWVMGMFPPYKKLDFETSAKVIENMMRAHDQIYTRLKARHADFQVGFSHDPIEFSPYHKKHPLWAPVEKGVCHVLTEVNGGAFDRMMETGEFELRVPFLCNYSFKLPRKPPMDFFGLQFYTRPLVQISLCGAGSVSRVPGEKITSYEYRQYPQGIVSALGKYGKLKTPTGQPVKIKITEVGIDRGINRDETDAQRIAYFDRINQAVKFAKDHGVEVDEIDYWTLIDNSEWYKRWGVRFGFYKFDPATGAIERLPLARWVADRVAARNRALPQPAAAPAA